MRFTIPYRFFRSRSRSQEQSQSMPELIEDLEDLVVDKSVEIAMDGETLCLNHDNASIRIHEDFEGKIIVVYQLDGKRTVSESKLTGVDVAVHVIEGHYREMMGG